MHSLHSKFKPCPFKGGHKSILKKYHFCKKDIHFSEKNIILYVSVLFPLLPSKALLCVHTWSQVEFLALFCGHLLKKKVLNLKEVWNLLKHLNLVAKPNDVFSFPC